MKLIKLTSSLFFIASFTLSFGCNSSETDIGSAYSLWQSEKDAKEAYPNLPADEAQRRHATNLFKTKLSKLESEKDRELFISYFYLGYSQINSNAVYAYCKKLGPDVTPFLEAFRSMNATEESAINRILNKHGLSQEQIWEERKPKLMKQVKFRLLKLAGHNGTYSLCKKLKEYPQRYLDGMSFRSLLPEVAKKIR